MPSSMQKTARVFLIGFGAMLLLIFVPGIAALRQTAQIYEDIQTIQQAHEHTQNLLFRIERVVLQASVTVREFLLDDSPATGRAYREQLAAAKKALDEDFKTLVQSAPAGKSEIFSHLHGQVDGYWRSITPLFDWSPAERASRAAYFLREQSRPRRESILAIADETVRLSRENYRRRYEEMSASRRRYRKGLEIAVTAEFLLGLAAALWTLVRVSSLEGQAERQRLATLHAEQQMRTLSARLMQAQEEERRTIARELHDEVGQMLTSLRFALGALERLNALPTEEYRQHLGEAKSTAEQTLRTVRDIAIGLRPTVLDLGLEPALRWQARQFSRSTGTDASVRVNGAIPFLPDPYLTCIYRVVQEALTNSARHANAANVEISMDRQENQLELLVADDGVGLPADWHLGRGMGLVGMEERVREIGGAFSIGSRNGAGVLITVRLPIPEGGDA